jgi:hypothetical protein
MLTRIAARNPLASQSRITRHLLLATHFHSLFPDLLYGDEGGPRCRAAGAWSDLIDCAELAFSTGQ